MKEQLSRLKEPSYTPEVSTPDQSIASQWLDLR